MAIRHNFGTSKDVLTMEGYTFSGWSSKDLSPKDGKFAIKIFRAV